MENESSYLLEVKRKVRDLVRCLRPVPGSSAQQSAASQTSAACALAGLFNRQPETRQLFLAEGGVLAALELLDAELARVAEAGLEVLRAFTASDTRLLESLCLVGLVPVVVRMAAAGGAVSSSWQAALGGGGGGSSSYSSAALAGGSGSVSGPGRDGGAAAAAAAAAGVGALALGGPPVHSGSSAEVTHLRRKAAGFVVQLCFAKDTTLQMFIACGGLRCLVVMVQDNLQDCNTLTPVAVTCIWQVLETYGALPINYICRIFAGAGLVPRLFAVIKQLTSLSRQQQQQQQRGIGSFGAQGAGAPVTKLQHLNCPLTPQGLPFATSDFFPLGSLGAGGGRDAPQAAADSGSDASGPMSVPVGSKALGSSMLGGRKGSPVVEAGLAGEHVSVSAAMTSSGICSVWVAALTYRVGHLCQLLAELKVCSASVECAPSGMLHDSHSARCLLLCFLCMLGPQVLMSCSSSNSTGAPCPTATTAAAQQQVLVAARTCGPATSSSSSSRRGRSGCRRSVWTCCWCWPMLTVLSRG